MTRVLLLAAATAFCVWIFWRILNQSGGLTALFRALLRFTGLTREENSPPRRSRESERALRRRQERRDALLALTVEEAAARALGQLNDARLWRCGPPLEAEPPFEPGPKTAELFSRYARVESARGMALLSLADAVPYTLPSTEVLSFGQSAEPARTYWRIGTDFSECPMLMSPQSDEVIVVRKLTTAGGRFYTIEYPSIYHWLLIQNDEA